MRRQYHFWPGESGIDAWDVHRLIDLGRNLPVVEVALADIDEIDTVYWFDRDKEQPTVRRVVEHVRLIDEVDPIHPIILGPGNRVMDGMHRIARALIAGQATIRAVRFDEVPPPDHRDCDPGQLP